MNKAKALKGGPKLSADFFRQGNGGAEPVRDWLLSLPQVEKSEIGKDIMAVQFGWHQAGQPHSASFVCCQRKHDGAAPRLYQEKPKDTQTRLGFGQRAVKTTERFEMKNEHIGSSFEDFLREEGLYEEVEAAAIKKVVACMIEKSMQESRVTKSEMALRMGTSRTQLNRLLDPAYPSVTLATIAKAASALGKKISISFGDMAPEKTIGEHLPA